MKAQLTNGIMQKKFQVYIDGLKKNGEDRKEALTRPAP